ncbi:MAG: hypothetical protein K6G87_04615 [Butyrivibrio sp.]|jgi:hypothetical protein|uniref:hypothetical protein n=1 Tax=Butyrivibrio sp. TaxID=28121 RepID=UPI0025FABF69|nr:hypothetical protein [Butyrivibrio sp.]MCR5770502.1 hypothetical protein [Butyrivibrio sp.]
MRNIKKRKRYITIILLSFLTIVSGCNKVNDSNKDIDENARTGSSDTNVSNSATDANASNGASDDAQTIVDDTAINGENDATETASKESTADQYKKYKEYISPKKKEEIHLDSESESLYEGFLYGDIKAEYVLDGDITRALCLAEVLTDGESYTLTEIEEKLCDGCEYAEDWIYENNICEEYIDLGLDGTYELKTDIGAAAFNLTLVVKNVDGHLKICFAGDSWDSSFITVLFTGGVSLFNRESNTIHSAEQGFLDENGNYKFWNRSKEEGFHIGETGDLYYNDQFIGSGIGLYVIEISFDTEAVEPYYYVYIVDIDNNTLEEENSNPQDPYNLARAALEAEGKNAITMDELQILQDEKRQEIGFDDKLYYYGEELKPDEE